MILLVVLIFTLVKVNIIPSFEFGIVLLETIDVKSIFSRLSLCNFTPWNMPLIWYSGYVFSLPFVVKTKFYFLNLISFLSSSLTN